MRTPTAAQQVTALANAAFQTVASELLSDRRAFAERHREASGSLADDDEIERLRQEMLDGIRGGRVRVSGEGGAAFGSALEVAISNVPAVFAFDWTLLHAPEGGLITSDRGIAIDDPTPPYPSTAQAPLSSDNSETMVLLSDEHLLAMRPGAATCGLDVRHVSSHDVETLNLGIYGWADTNRRPARRALEADRRAGRASARASGRMSPSRGGSATSRCTRSTCSRSAGRRGLGGTSR